MTKDLGVKPYLFPMPTYMIGTYNEDSSVDVMMMAWGWHLRYGYGSFKPRGRPQNSG